MKGFQILSSESAKPGNNTEIIRELIVMTLPISLQNCANTLRNLTKSIKNYTHIIPKDRRTRPREALEREGHAPYPPTHSNRKSRFNKALNRILRLKPRPAIGELRVEILVEKELASSSGIHNPISGFPVARLEVYPLPPPPNSNMSDQQYLTVGGTVDMQEDIQSFVDSGYAIDTVPQDNGSFSSIDLTGADEVAGSTVDQSQYESATELSTTEEQETHLPLLYDDTNPSNSQLSPMSLNFSAFNPQLHETDLAFFYFLEDTEDPQGNGDNCQCDNSFPVSAGHMGYAVLQNQENECYIHIIPLEILQHIFSYTLPEPTPPVEWKLDTPWPHPMKKDTPFVLRSVCRYWNTVASTPSLWNSMAWSVAMPTKRDSQGRLAWIKSRFERTKSAPVNYVSCEIGNEPLTSNGYKMLGMVSRTIANCQAARIVLPEWHRLGPGDVPSHPDLVHDMPRLRVLSWTSPHKVGTTLLPEWRLPWTNVMEAPWAQLTSAFLNCPLTMDDCLNVLKRAPQLDTIEFNNIFREANLRPNTAPDCTPSYHALSSLKIHSTVNVGQLFHDMAFPNLIHLHLHLPYLFGRLQDLKISWNLLATVVLNCPLDLVEAYRLIRSCKAATRIQWDWPNEIGSSFPLSGLGQLTQDERAAAALLELPLLHSLTITPSIPGGYVEPLLRLMPGIMQNLHIMTLPSFPMLKQISSPEGLTPFDKLSAMVLTSTPISIPQCLLIIRKSAYLRKLDVVVQKHDNSIDSDVSWPTRILQSDLTSLTVRTMLKNLQPLLDWLILPQLASLELLSQPHERGPNSLNGELDWMGTKDYSYGPEQQGLWKFLSRRPELDGVPPFLERLDLQDIDVEETELDLILTKAATFKTEVNLWSVKEINHDTKTSKCVSSSYKYIY